MATMLSAQNALQNEAKCSAGQQMELTLCAECKQRVIPMNDGMCPGCRKTLVGAPTVTVSVPPATANESTTGRKIEARGGLIKGDRILAWVILTALLSLLVYVLFWPCHAEDRWRIRVTKNKLSIYQSALELFKLDCGSFPSETEGFQALVHNPGRKDWAGPYLRTDDINDAWDRQVEYHIQNDVPVLRSAGKDKLFGSDDDIVHRYLVGAAATAGGVGKSAPKK